MLTCKQFDDFLLDFCDGNLPYRQRMSMYMHLGLCRDCREFMQRYERAVAIGRRACAHDVDLADVPEGLVQAVLANLQSGNRD